MKSIIIAFWFAIAATAATPSLTNEIMNETMEIATEIVDESTQAEEWFEEIEDEYAPIEGIYEDKGYIYSTENEETIDEECYRSDVITSIAAAKEIMEKCSGFWVEYENVNTLEKTKVELNYYNMWLYSVQLEHGFYRISDIGVYDFDENKVIYVYPEEEFEVSPYRANTINIEARFNNSNEIVNIDIPVVEPEEDNNPIGRLITAIVFVIICGIGFTILYKKFVE